MELIGKLTIFFAATGAIAGGISGFLPNSWYALLIALILFYASYKLTTYEKFKIKVLKISTGGLPGGKEKIIMTGFWPYFIIWLIVWVIVYTLLLVK